MEVPKTVATALADQPVDGAVCLEAGAGAGNTTTGLLARGATQVYAISNERDHVETVRDRLAADDLARVRLLEADLRAIPLPDDSVDVVTAHGLFNVVPTAALGAIASELTRVAAPGCHLVVDDYEPLPDDSAVADLFALENAAMELADGRPALVFYPATVLRTLFAGYGWTFERERTLLDPVPWTGAHVEAHADVVREVADRLPDGLATDLTAEADRLEREIGSESTGEMYSLGFSLPAGQDED